MSMILMSDIAPHLLPVITAVIAAAAALGGAGMTRSTQRESARIQLLDVTVQRLSERVEALEKSVSAAEARRDEAVEAERQAHAIKWIAIDYAGRLLRWARLVPDAEPPEPPREIEDLM